MDDIKWYAKNKQDIHSLIHLIWWIQDIEMSFRLDKYGQMVVRNRKVVKTVESELPGDNTVDNTADI